MSKIDFYHCFYSPPSRNVFFTLKALNVPFEEHQLDIIKHETKDEKFLKMNPHGIVPTIIDNGFTLWESKAIVTYIFDKYAKPEHQNFYPRDLRKRAIVDRLLYYDATAFYPSVLAIIEAIVYKRRKPNEDEYNTLINRLENIEKIYFTNSLFLTGSKITLADVSFFTSLTALDPFGFDYSKFEGVSRFVNSIKETDWFKCENGDYANFCESFSNDLREKGLI